MANSRTAGAAASEMERMVSAFAANLPTPWCTFQPLRRAQDSPSTTVVEALGHLVHLEQREVHLQRACEQLDLRAQGALPGALWVEIAHEVRLQVVGPRECLEQVVPLASLQARGVPHEFCPLSAAASGEHKAETCNHLLHASQQPRGSVGGALCPEVPKLAKRIPLLADDAVPLHCLAVPECWRRAGHGPAHRHLHGHARGQAAVHQVPRAWQRLRAPRLPRYA
eukprot:scaffold68845_cov63-Phaeocystis_antarctica.AAC.3